MEGNNDSQADKADAEQYKSNAQGTLNCFFYADHSSRNVPVLGCNI